MRLPLLISLSLLLLSWQKVQAQLAPADDFFNSGAQLYISNNIPGAKSVTEMGLKLYPEDEKLKKLEQLLNQQQQQQQQNKQNQQQQSSSQNNQQQQKQQQQDKQQQNQSEQQKNEQQKQQPQDQQNGSGAKPDNLDQNAAGQTAKATQMTPEEAKKLLDSQKDNEKILPISPNGKPRNPLRTVKDW